MKILFYKIIYNKFINPIIRYILDVYNQLPLQSKIHIGLNGLIPFKIDQNLLINLEMNESSPMCMVYWNNPAKFEFTPVFKELIKECDVFFDVGSNIGFYSFLASKANPNTIIHSFEPSFGANYYLNRNKEHNKAKNVNVHNLALSDSNGQIMFHEEINPKYPYLKYFLSGISNTTNTNGMRESSTYEVKTTTLDEFVNLNKITKLDLVKIDTEGTEYSILSESIKSINQLKPIIICEVLTEKAVAEIKSLASDIGYLSFIYENNKLVKSEQIKIGTSELDRNVFLIHHTKEHLFSKLT